MSNPLPKKENTLLVNKNVHAFSIKQAKSKEQLKELVLEGPISETKVQKIEEYIAHKHNRCDQSNCPFCPKIKSIN